MITYFVDINTNTTNNTNTTTIINITKTISIINTNDSTKMDSSNTTNITNSNSSISNTIKITNKKASSTFKSRSDHPGDGGLLRGHSALIYSYIYLTLPLPLSLSLSLSLSLFSRSDHPGDGGLLRGHPPHIGAGLDRDHGHELDLWHRHHSKVIIIVTNICTNDWIYLELGLWQRHHIEGWLNFGINAVDDAPLTTSSVICPSAPTPSLGKA